MRNLKKVLALVLALAMALSVMASAFTAPEYTEEAKAEYDAMTAAQQNAFYVVSALGIVEGFSDGSFRPEENLTRAQFAAMVYRAKTGDIAKENALFANASVIFTDAIDTWAIPYVAYAYSAGIVAGYPDGTFKATKSVTGLEAAKMLLTALGYDAEIEGLVGPTFYANTIKLATAAGLFEGVKGDIYAPATRADAFVMFANALKANTVTYIGGVATPKTTTLSAFDTITLAEEGFDLIDTEAVLVATADWALEGYDKARDGYVTFAKGDFVFPVALGDQAAKFAELGHKYRVLVDLDTKVMYGYPVEVATGSYYKVTLAGALAKAPVDDATTIFANGEKVDLDTAKELIEDNKNSTATYKSIDTNGDGKAETVFLNIYTIGIVKAIDGNKVTFIGKNLNTKEIANAAEFAVGDYAAVWTDGDGAYAKKLEVKEANVTGYDGKYTIDGAKYSIGSYINAGAESLLGSATTAITETVYKFVFDGSYIVNVELTANTKFAKYALVDFIFNEGRSDLDYTYLGYPMVRLFTEDNEYVMAYVKTVDGYQIYDWQQFYSLTDAALAPGALVTYELDGDYVYLNTISSEMTFEGNTVSYDYDFIYNRATDTWEGKTTNSTVSFKDTHGVVFVSYCGGFSTTDPESCFRAYYNGEFQPNYYNDLEAKVMDGNEDLVVYATQNGVNYIKAAVITFDHRALGYDLPGLPTTRTGDNFSIIAKAPTVEKTADGYVYTYTVYEPWSTSTKTLTSVPFAYQQNQPAANTVYNLKTNADGKVTAWTALNFDIDADDKYPVLEDTYYTSSNGIDMYGYLVTGFNMDVYGNIVLTVSDIIGNAPVAATYTLNISADADVWFFTAEDDALTAEDWFSYVGYDYNNAPADEKFIAYIDMNATTQTANRLILVSGAYAEENAPETVNVKAIAAYSTKDKVAKYYFDYPTFIEYIDVLNEIVMLDENGNRYFEVTDLYPWETEFSLNGEVEITFENINGVWTATAIKGVEGYTLYSNSIDEEGVVDGIQYFEFSTSYINIKTDVDKRIALEDIDAVYYYREYNDRLDYIYSDIDFKGAYSDDIDDVKALTANVTATKADADVASYEGIKVVETVDGNYIIVLIDTTAANTETNVYPFAEAGDNISVDDDDDKSNQNDAGKDTIVIL